MNAKGYILRRFNYLKVGIAIVLQVYGGCKVDDIQPINRASSYSIEARSG